MKLALLAAGFATRMYPLTVNYPKPLLEIQGQVLLTRLLNQALETGVINEAAVIVNEKFKNKFLNWASRQDYPVNVVVNKAKEPENSQGALNDLRMLFEQGYQTSDESPWMILAGDNLIDFPLYEAVCMQARNVEQPLFLVREIEDAVPPNRYSEVTLDRSGLVVNIREKPDNPSSSLSAICAYLMPPDFPYLLNRYLNLGGKSDAPGHMMEWLVKERNCYAWRIPYGSFWDIGNFTSYELANQVSLKYKIV